MPNQTNGEKTIMPNKDWIIIFAFYIIPIGIILTVLSLLILAYTGVRF
jgi:hypothetical protein